MLQGLVQAFFYSLAAVLASWSFLERGQAQVERSPVFSALAERAAGIKIAAADQWFLCDHLTNPFHDRFGALKAGAFRQGEIPPHLALIFIGNKGGGNRGQSYAREHQTREDQPQNDATSWEPERQGLAIPDLQTTHSMAQPLADALHRPG